MTNGISSAYRLDCRKKCPYIREVPGLGYIPTVNEEENRNMLAALIGVKMGSGNKASTYNWFKNRLSDTQGTIVPRSMIDIFAKAAGREIKLQKEGTQPIGKSMIRPRCFEDILPEVSEKRVIDLKEEFLEYARFFDSLKDWVQRSPVEEAKLYDALQRSGFKNPREEIYLRGLGLQRSGMR